MKETTRVQFELPSSSIERLKALKDKTEAASYAEVAKNALKLYERMIDLADSGQKLLIRDKRGETKELELFL
jgi:hypothetical protein